MKMMLTALLALPSLPLQTADYVIQIGEKNYHPDNLEVRVGDRVTWKNVDAEDHTVTSEARSSGPNTQDRSFDSGRIPSGGSFDQVFLREGTVRYYCRFHESTTGMVTVKQAR